MVCRKPNEVYFNIADKMKLIRQKLKGADVLDEFDRVVFESIVEKVVVGDMEENGTADICAKGYG